MPSLTRNTKYRSISYSGQHDSKGNRGVCEVPEEQLYRLVTEFMKVRGIKEIKYIPSCVILELFQLSLFFISMYTFLLYILCHRHSTIDGHVI